MLCLFFSMLRGLHGGKLKSVFLVTAILTFCGSIALAAPPDTMPVWRAQLRVLTGPGVDSSSDDNVKVGLRPGNTIWLESGHNDFEQNGTITYDLRLEGIAKLGDIDYLRIEKTGSDGWEIRKIELLINQRVIYTETFPRGLWLDNDDGHSRVFFKDDSFMRNRSAWSSYVRPVRPQIISVNDITKRIEALVGNFAIEDSDVLMAREGNASVEASTFDGDTWSVDLDLEEYKLALPNNPDLDTDFKLSVSCSNSRVTFAVSEITVQSGWPRDASGKVYNFVNGNFVNQLNDMMKGYTFTRVRPCPFMVLAANGDLNIIPHTIGPNETIVLRRQP